LCVGVCCMNTCEIHGIDGGERGCPLCITHLTKPKKAPFGTVRHELKKNSASGSGRYIKASDYLKCIGKAKARQGGVCVALLAGIDHECEDPFDWLHGVNQSVIAAKLGPDSPALTDDRIGAYGCRWTNASLDEWRGPLRDIDTRLQLKAFWHPGFELAVIEYGLEVEAERKWEGT
jgi:hypothetical protein